MTTLTVGTGAGDYASLGTALAATQNGDTINLPGGVYYDQTATVATNVTIQGVGGTAYLVATQPVSNAKGILVVDAPGTVTINNVSFSGAATSNANGANAAGIRYQGGNLVLNNDALWGNQNGILATPGSPGTGSIAINNSTVTNNGVSDPSLTAGYGYTHNLYVNDVASLSITGSTITAANVGHEVKSRAQSTTITNNVIADGPTGTASYSIDLPNGGNGTIRGNTIQQGPASQNPAIISNGEEGNLHAGSLAVTGNTIINNDPSPSSVAVVNATSTPATVTGNLITGLSSGQIDKNAADTVSNNTLTNAQPNIGLQVLVDGTTVATGSATAATLSTDRDRPRLQRVDRHRHTRAEPVDRGEREQRAHGKLRAQPAGLHRQQRGGLVLRHQHRAVRRDGHMVGLRQRQQRAVRHGNLVEQSKLHRFQRAADQCFARVWSVVRRPLFADRTCHHRARRNGAATGDATGDAAAAGAGTHVLRAAGRRHRRHRDGAPACAPEALGLRPARTQRTGSKGYALGSGPGGSAPWPC